MGAASYHLAGYSAMAYSLMSQVDINANLSPAERAVVRLLLCDLMALRSEAETWLKSPDHSDDFITARIAAGEDDIDTACSVILTTAAYSSFTFFDFALQTGGNMLHQRALTVLNSALKVAQATGAVTLWWLIRLASNLITDLWSKSLHQLLPLTGPTGEEWYDDLRELFLTSLYVRKIAEVELWPSQIEAAKRSVDLTDDLVVALPTSAGKTRIAEICTLMTLSAGKRVLLVTPLRALSAQTERSFRKTFEPLGFSVSSLYGASGAMPGDQDTLRSSDIVIATPEKLDFALRSAPN